MSKISLLLLVVAVSSCGAAVAIEPVVDLNVNYGGYSGDPWRAPVPSGLRFGGEPQQVLTGGHGGYGYGYGYGSGCENGVCLHWTQYGWFGSWDGHHGPKHGKHGCYSCGNGCRAY